MDVSNTNLSLLNRQANAPDTSRIEALARTGDRAKIREAAENFESMFLSEMVKPMFEGLSSDGMFKGGYAEDVFNSMLVQEYGKSLSASGGIGLADMIERQLLNLQEVA